MKKTVRTLKDGKLYCAKFEDGEVWIKAPSLIGAAKYLEDLLLAMRNFGAPEREELHSIMLEERPTEEVEVLATGDEHGFYNRIFLKCGYL